MDLSPPLIAAAAFSVGVFGYDVYRRGSTDVFEAVLLGELGVLLGTVLGALVPGGFLVGCVGGAALSVKRFRELLAERRRLLDATVASSESPAALLLSLHDHLDRLVGKPAARVHQAMSWAAMCILGSVAVVALALGITSGAVPITLLGVVLAFPPVARLAQKAVEQHECEQVQALLSRAQDPALPEVDSLQNPVG